VLDFGEPALDIPEIPKRPTPKCRKVQSGLQNRQPAGVVDELDALDAGILVLAQQSLASVRERPQLTYGSRG
jgi:hypothetical protein